MTTKYSMLAITISHFTLTNDHINSILLSVVAFSYAFQALVNALQIYTNYTGQLKCLSIESAFDASMAGWEFQVCFFFVLHPNNRVFSSRFSL